MTIAPGFVTTGGMDKTYLIYGTLDGTTITVFRTVNLDAESRALRDGEVKLLEFKAPSWDDAVSVKDQLRGTLARVRAATFNACIPGQDS